MVATSNPPFTAEEQRKFRVWWSIAEGREKQDYAKNPEAWKAMAWRICENEAQKRGIENRSIIKKYITDPVFNTLDEIGLADRNVEDQMRLLFIHLDRAIEDRRAMSEMNERNIPFGQRVQDGMYEHYRLNGTVLRNIIHEEDAYNRTLPQHVRLARVAYRCENDAYNKGDVHAGHWFAKNGQLEANGRDFLEYAFEVMLKKGVDYKQWMLTLKQSVEVATFYNLTCTYEETIDKFDAFMDAWSPNDGDLTAHRAALSEEKRNKEQKLIPIPPKLSSDLAAVFPDADKRRNAQIEDNKVTDTATQATDSVAANLSKFWGTVNGQLNKYQSWRELDNKQKGEVAHGAIGCSSLKDATQIGVKEGADIVIAKFIKSQTPDDGEQPVSTKNAQEAQQTDTTRPTTPETQNAPASGQNSSVEQPAQTTKPTPTPRKQPAQTTKLPIPTGAALTIKPAVKAGLKLRMALAGVAGGGKTRTALEIARAMMPNGNIAVLDTEARSALKFADKFTFSHIELDAPFSPERYIEGIQLAESSGMDFLIIDSATHAWKEDGGILNWVDAAKASGRYRTKDGKEDTQSIWADASPRHNALIQAILTCNMHVIVTLRAKHKEVPIRENGQIVGTRKIITEIVQRDGFPYEFDIMGKLQDPDRPALIIDKSRCDDLVGKTFPATTVGKEVGRILTDWLKDAPQPAQKSA